MTSFGQIPDIEDRVIIIDSVSKRFSACGARIGCMVCKNKEYMAQVFKIAMGRLCDLHWTWLALLQCTNCLLTSSTA